VDMHALKPCARSCFSSLENSTSRPSIKTPAKPRHPLRFQKSQQVRGLVERLFDQALERLNQAPQIALPLTQDHALIRPAAEYGELFNLGAQQQLTKPSFTTGEGIVNLARVRGQDGRCEDCSESERRILSKLGEFAPSDETGSKLFAVK
jgi:hypothetical protein